MLRVRKRPQHAGIFANRFLVLGFNGLNNCRVPRADLCTTSHNPINRTPVSRQLFFYLLYPLSHLPAPPPAGPLRGRLTIFPPAGLLRGRLTRFPPARPFRGLLSRFPPQE